MQLRVRTIREEAENIHSFELVPGDCSDLPAFAAGAHITVEITDTAGAPVKRDYSLCNDPADRHHYVIAVLKEQDGRGGSAAMHDRVRVGDTLTVSDPSNLFPLASADDGAEFHLLLAGGIGVTPLMAMVDTLERDGADWHMHYCTRTPASTAFLSRLWPLMQDGKVTVHHDDGDPANGLDLAGLVATHVPGCHVYFCGPPGFMTAVDAATAAWPDDCRHSEYFTAAAEPEGQPAPVSDAFQVQVMSSGQVLDVAADQTIVQVLLANGVDIETSCEQGFCGTCMTRYTGGEPDHRDVVLNEKSRQDYVMVCCARAKQSPLVLDL